MIFYILNGLIPFNFFWAFPLFPSPFKQEQSGNDYKCGLSYGGLKKSGREFSPSPLMFNLLLPFTLPVKIDLIIITIHRLCQIQMGSSAKSVVKKERSVQPNGVGQTNQMGSDHKKLFIIKKLSLNTWPKISLRTIFEAIKSRF
ncbi:MAG: hypothetical protein ACPLRA_00935, partial [Candidatus Saccharicenans sp.]